MKIVRQKDFETFIEGRNELLTFILPYNIPLYNQLINCETYDDTFSKLQRNNIYLIINRNSLNGFTFKLIFEVSGNNHVQTLLNCKYWDLVEDECIGLSDYDKLKIRNDLW